MKTAYIYQFNLLFQYSNKESGKRFKRSICESYWSLATSRQSFHKRKSPGFQNVPNIHEQFGGVFQVDQTGVPFVVRAHIRLGWIRTCNPSRNYSGLFISLFQKCYLCLFFKFNKDAKNIERMLEEYKRNLTNILTSHSSNYLEDIERIEVVKLNLTNLQQEIRQSLSVKSKSVKSFKLRNQKLRAPQDKCKCLIDYNRNQVIHNWQSHFGVIIEIKVEFIFR